MRERDNAAASRMHRDRHSTNAQALSPLLQLSWDGKVTKGKKEKKTKVTKEKKRKPPSTEPMSVALPWLFVAAVARIRLVSHHNPPWRCGRACRAGKKKKSHEILQSSRDGCLANDI